jgi:hypothetical protein
MTYILSSRRSMDEALEKQAQLDVAVPDWRTQAYASGARCYDGDGTLLDENGRRSIFDDVDE